MVKKEDLIKGVRQTQYKLKLTKLKSFFKGCSDPEIVGLCHEILDDTPYKTRNYDEYSHDSYYIRHNKNSIIRNSTKKITLKPNLKKSTDIINLVQNRNSFRDYSFIPIDFRTFSTIIHYTFGVKNIEHGAYNEKYYPFKFVNSQGGLNYLDLYIVVNNITGLESGLYYYDFIHDQLCQMKSGNMRPILSNIHYANEFVAYGDFTCFIIADLTRVMPKYFKRSYRMAHVDSGIVIAYLELLAESFGIHSCTVAGYLEHQLDEFLNLSTDDYPVISITFGEK